MGTFLLFFVKVKLYFGKVKVFASATTEDVDDVIAGGLKVGSRIKGLRDENLTFLAVVFGLVQIADHDKPKSKREILSIHSNNLEEKLSLLLLDWT